MRNLPSAGARCSVGSPSGVSASGGLTNPNARWTWSCAGSNGGSSASCSANRRIHGQCSSAASATNITNQPSGSLCNRGLQTGVSGTKENGWTWNCNGINGGNSVSCSPIGMCNASHDHNPEYEPTVSADFQGSPWGLSVGAAAPADTVRMSWEGQWSSAESGNHSTATCNTTNFFNLNEGNNYDMRPGDEMGLGESRIYRVQCSESLCGNVRSDNVRIGIPIPEFTAFSLSSQIVRSGGTVDLDWQITSAGRNPYPMECNLRGAASYDFPVPTEASGSITSPPIRNKFLNRLQCIEPVTFGSGQNPSEVTVTNEVEVVASPFER